MRGISIIFTMGLLMATQWVNGQNGLVAHWSFDKLVDDTIYDVSQQDHHGTNYGGHLVEGVKGKALDLNGVRDYARIPKDWEDPPDTLSKLEYGSISVWFKVRQIPTDYGIAPIFYYGAQRQCDFFDAANKGFIIELGHSPIHQGSKYLYYTVWKDGCTFPSLCYDSNEAIPENKWQHFVVVIGKDYNTGYLNGEEMVNRIYNFGNGSDSQFFADALAHKKLWLGKGYWDRTTQYFDGVIDEIRIYNRPLSGSEVKELYNSASVATAVAETEINPDQVKVYPNPASQQLYYEVKGVENVLQTIEVTDVTGKRVLGKSDVPRKGTLNIDHLPEGIYFVGFHGQGVDYQKKVLINP